MSLKPETTLEEAMGTDWRPGVHYAIQAGERIDMLKAEVLRLREACLRTLEALHINHVPTWASMEPVIFPTQSLELIKASLPYCDEYRLGKVNHAPAENWQDWKGYLLEARSLIRGAEKKLYIKDDLWAAGGAGILRGLAEREPDWNNAKPWTVRELTLEEGNP